MKILGWIEHPECDCCGRRDLTRALAVQSDDGDVVHFGSDCARRHLGLASSRDLSAAVKSEAARIQAMMDQHHRAVYATAAYHEANRLVDEARAARIPFNERPARIREAREEARRIADAQFSADDLAAMHRYSQNPSAYC